MNKLIKYAFRDLGTSILMISIVFGGFFMLEPQIGRAIEDQHTITQTITSEISFSTAAANVTMNGSLGGITGGTSNGTTTVVVVTNDSSGYTMTIKASNTPAMQANTQGTSIADYTPVNPSVPDLEFSVPSSAEFAYSVAASSSSEVALKFKNDGSACMTGAAGSIGLCWHALSTGATTTVVTTSETTASGSTSSIYYRLKISANSAVAEDTYVATTTLTATTN